MLPRTVHFTPPADRGRRSDSDSGTEGESAKGSANQFPMRDSPQLAGSQRKKVALSPGHSATDWTRLKASGADLRGGAVQLQRYTPSDIAHHRTKEDLWMAFQGKVYCCTNYLHFHPGGVGQLMRGAGKDATELFNKIHPWVNLEYILGDKCLVGYLIPESMKSLDPPKPSAAVASKSLHSSNIPGESSVPVSRVVHSIPRHEIERPQAPVQFKMFAPKAPIQIEHASKMVEENFGRSAPAGSDSDVVGGIETIDLGSSKK
ncbi:hypothetical protein HDU98_007162 [Podochytrium sp. JEL0797]|nr:hypothetical protein HDU98_007162 [Podochytrium sp. JEL0797]